MWYSNIFKILGDIQKGNGYLIPYLFVDKIK